MFLLSSRSLNAAYEAGGISAVLPAVLSLTVWISIVAAELSPTALSPPPPGPLATSSDDIAMCTVLLLV